MLGDKRHGEARWTSRWLPVSDDFTVALASAEVLPTQHFRSARVLGRQTIDRSLHSPVSHQCVRPSLRAGVHGCIMQGSQTPWSWAERGTRNELALFFGSVKNLVSRYVRKKSRTDCTADTYIALCTHALDARGNGLLPQLNLAVRSLASPSTPIANGTSSGSKHIATMVCSSTVRPAFDTWLYHQ